MDQEARSRLDAVIEQLNQARSLPMSSSCVVNRPELVNALGTVRDELPEQLDAARDVLARRDALIQEGHEEAERLVTRAKRERDVLVSETEVAREARREADRVLAKARRDAEEVRRKADDYVDVKLATFEVVLGRTLDAVGRGRATLLGRQPIEDLGEAAGAAEDLRPRGERAVFDGVGEPPHADARDEPPAEETGSGSAAACDDPETEISGFFDTSGIDVARLRDLHEQKPPEH